MMSTDKKFSEQYHDQPRRGGKTFSLKMSDVNVVDITVLKPFGKEWIDISDAEMFRLIDELNRTTT